MIISTFTKKIIQHIRKIPEGEVATYKQIAELAGKPQGSRGVAWVLHSSSIAYKLPWHRVLNSQGKISFDKKSTHYREQKKRLEKEGVEFKCGGQLSLSDFQWNKKASKASYLGKPKLFS